MIKFILAIATAVILANAVAGSIDSVQVDTLNHHASAQVAAIEVR